MIEYKISDYLMIKEAAALIGVNPNTLRNWERAGKIKVYRNEINKYRLYLKEDLYRVIGQIQPNK